MKQPYPINQNMIEIAGDAVNIQLDGISQRDLTGESLWCTDPMRYNGDIYQGYFNVITTAMGIHKSWAALQYPVISKYYGGYITPLQGLSWFEQFLFEPGGAWTPAVSMPPGVAWLAPEYPTTLVYSVNNFGTAYERLPEFPSENSALRESGVLWASETSGYALKADPYVPGTTLQIWYNAGVTYTFGWYWADVLTYPTTVKVAKYNSSGVNIIDNVGLKAITLLSLCYSGMSFMPRRRTL